MYDRKRSAVYQDAFHYAAALADERNRESTFNKRCTDLVDKLGWTLGMVHGLQATADELGVWIDPQPIDLSKVKEWAQSALMMIDACAYSEGIDAYNDQPILDKEDSPATTTTAPPLQQQSGENHAICCIGRKVETDDGPQCFCICHAV